MRNFNIESLEIKNVSYIEKPKAIYKFIKNGFSVQEIVITRVSSCRYDMFASRQRKRKSSIYGLQKVPSNGQTYNYGGLKL